MTPRRGERQTGRVVRTGGRETDLRRGPTTREQRRTVLITTNGESTERAYFDALKREPWVDVKVAVAVERGSPVDLVRGTGRRQLENDYDEAWAVCDVDHYSPGDASAAARESGVRLAWSNPCFEVWLLLHLIHHAGHVETPRRPATCCASISRTGTRRH